MWRRRRPDPVEPPRWPSYADPVPSDFRGRWPERHPLNVPGPFYGAMTDTCCDGPELAPMSLMVDEAGQGFVWRQPRNHEEWLAVVAGCRSDPFSGFGVDGDAHWTVPLVRDWWHDLPAQQPRIRAIRRSWDGDDLLRRVAAEWAGYLSGPEIATDLRRYLFRLEVGRDPRPTDTLPGLG